jgi:hypothetical protein
MQILNLITLFAGQVTVDDVVFRVKDIPFVASYVQKEIAENA